MIIDNNIEAVKKCTAFFTIVRENEEINKQPIDCAYNCPYFKRLNEDHPEIGRCTYYEDTMKEVLYEVTAEPEDKEPPEPAQVRATLKVLAERDAKMQQTAYMVMKAAAEDDDCETLFKTVSDYQQKVLGNKDFDRIAFRRWMAFPFSGKDYKSKWKAEIQAEAERNPHGEGWVAF